MQQQHRFCSWQGGYISGVIRQHNFPHELHVQPCSRLTCVDGQVDMYIVMTPSLDSMEMVVRWKGTIDNIDNVNLLDLLTGARQYLSLRNLVESDDDQEVRVDERLVLGASHLTSSTHARRDRMDVKREAVSGGIRIDGVPRRVHGWKNRKRWRRRRRRRRRWRTASSNA